jgi:phosphoglycolate phosphatase
MSEIAETDLTAWTIVFDLDGTFVDTAPDLHRSLNHCLQKASYEPVPFDAVKDLIGHGAKAMIRQALAIQTIELSEDAIEPLWDNFLSYYKAHICDHSAPYPGAADTIEWIKDCQGKAAICTNKTQVLADELIEKLGFTAEFSSVVGADAVPRKKPDGDHIVQAISRAGGDPSKAVMIGDSQTDERAAHNAGLPFVFVTFGYGPAPDQSSMSFDVANTFQEVIDHIRKRVDA